MRVVRLVFLIFLGFTASFFVHSHIYAMSTGFETSDVDRERQEFIWKNIGLELTEVEAANRPIDRFDVNDEGFIALGFNSYVVNVYNPEGIFIYGYKFTGNGSYYIEWDEQNLLIYRVRSNIAVSVDKNGNCIEMREINNTLDNNRYWNSLRRTSKEVNGKKYEIQKNLGGMGIFAVSYSRAIIIDDSGKEKIIYDMTSTHILRILFFPIACIFLGFITFGAYKEIKRNNLSG